jgi:uncharacterized protein (TIGR02453 family)
MIQPATLAFLADLKANNHKSWFEANRKVYEAAKADFTQLVSKLILQLSAMDQALAQTPLDAKSCLLRINRDVRFSGDKTPYNTGFTAWLNPGGRKVNSAGYYLHIEPGESFLAGGLYQPEPELLARIRQEIDYNLPAFAELLAQPDFVRYFGSLEQKDALQRPPKGYDADNPAAAYLKLKSFTASHALPDELLTQPQLLNHIATVMGSLQPLNAYLNQGIEVS